MKRFRKRKLHHEMILQEEFKIVSNLRKWEK